MVPGEGPLPSLGMIVGEAPGPREWEEGRPFVGPSGNLLNQALEICGVARGELYVTNVVKIWPRDVDGKTRRPDAEELAVWRPVFDAELEQCSPATVLLLGKTAADAWGWSPGDAETHNIFAAWHPAYVGRQTGFEPYGEAFEKWMFQLHPFALAYQHAVERA